MWGGAGAPAAPAPDAAGAGSDDSLRRCSRGSAEISYGRHLSQARWRFARLFALSIGGIGARVVHRVCGPRPLLRGSALRFSRRKSALSRRLLAPAPRAHCALLRGAAAPPEVPSRRSMNSSRLSLAGNLPFTRLSPPSLFSRSHRAGAGQRLRLRPSLLLRPSWRPRRRWPPLPHPQAFQGRRRGSLARRASPSALLARFPCPPLLHPSTSRPCRLRPLRPPHRCQEAARPGL